MLLKSLPTVDVGVDKVSIIYCWYLCRWSHYLLLMLSLIKSQSSTADICISEVTTYCWCWGRAVNFSELLGMRQRRTGICQLQCSFWPMIIDPWESEKRGGGSKLYWRCVRFYSLFQLLAWDLLPRREIIQGCEWAQIKKSEKIWKNLKKLISEFGIRCWICWTTWISYLDCIL